MLRPKSLGRLVAWTLTDQPGYLRMRYLMPRPLDTQLFLALPGSQIRVDGEQVRGAVSVNSQRIWLEATLGGRELTVSFEKLSGRVPHELISWFEDGLEEFTGCSTLLAPEPDGLRKALRFAA